MANIVIVDDDRPTLDLLVIIMQEQGHTVVGRATSPEDADQMYHVFLEEGVRVDVGIIDGLESRGEEVATVQKSIFPDSKVIALSGEEQNWGNTNMMKPPDMSALAAAVRALVP